MFTGSGTIYRNIIDESFFELSPERYKVLTVEFGKGIPVKICKGNYINRGKEIAVNSV